MSKETELTAEMIEADLEDTNVQTAGDEALIEEAVIEETLIEETQGEFSVETTETPDAEEAFRRQEMEGSIRVNPDSQKGESLSSLYRNRRNKSANAAEKKEIYGADWDGVRLVGEADDFQTNARKRKEEYLKLSHSQKGGQILTGSIIGAVNTEYAPLAIVSLEDFGEFQVKIPAQRLFDFDEKVLASADGKSIIMNELNHRIGSQISFIVKSVDEVAGVAYACRINAMDIAGKVNFIDLQRGASTPFLFAGIKTNARVLAIHRENIVCEVGGVECIIPKEELSWTPMRELNKEFSIGDKFLVKILNVERYSTTKGNDTFRNMIRLDVSKRQAEPNPNQKFFNMFAEGAVYNGEVKYCTQGVIHVLVAGRIGCVCPVPVFTAGVGGELPTRGQKCLVRIHNKEVIERSDGSKDYRIGGRIIRYHTTV